MFMLDNGGLSEGRIKPGRLILALFIMFGSWLFFGEMAVEAAKVRPKENQAGEIKILITADQVEFDPQDERATYTGKVTVTQDDTSLYADRIEVRFIGKGKDIDLIKAYGNIRIVQGDRVITAEEGTYYHQERKVVLTGSPVTRQGVNCISGDKIVYFWNEGKALVEGNVKATIAVDKEKMEMMRPK